MPEVFDGCFDCPESLYSSPSHNGHYISRCVHLESSSFYRQLPPISAFILDCMESSKTSAHNLWKSDCNNRQHNNSSLSLTYVYVHSELWHSKWLPRSRSWCCDVTSRTSIKTTHETYTRTTLPRIVVHTQTAYQSWSRHTIQYNGYELRAARQNATQYSFTHMDCHMTNPALQSQRLMVVAG